MEQHPWKTLERTRKEKDGNSKCKQKWGPATHLPKPNKEASWGKGEVCFILYASNGPLVGSRGGEEGWCYIQRQHSQLWQLSWNWSCGDLTSLVLLFLGTVSPQFQGQFVSITLRQILDSKEIKPLNLKGNQLWIYIGRTDAEAETPISWSSDAFSFCPQSFPASGTFPMSRLFTSDDQNTGALASASVLPMSEYSGLITFKMDWLTSLLYKGLSGVFSSTTVQRHQISGLLPSLQSNSCNHTWPLERQ